MRKKILFVSTLASVMHFPTRDALERLGFEVHFVDFRGNPILENSNVVHRAIHRLPVRAKNYLYGRAHEAIGKRVLATANEIRPSFIFVTKAKDLAVPVLDALRNVAPTINWYADMMSNWGSIKKIIDHYDYFFNYDRYVIDLLHKEGHPNAYHLPWAGHLAKNAQWPDTKERLYNLTFLGSYHPELFPREASFEGLKELGLHIWGNKGWLKTPLKDCYRGYIDPRRGQGEIQRVYSDSKIGLYFDSLYGVPGTGITLRPFEITSAGAMMLGQVFREELAELFTAGKEFIAFRGIGDLQEKARYYLAHEDERRSIAKNGFERVRSEHTYEDRVRRIFDVIEHNPPKR